MKTAAIRDLRNNFSKIEAWLASGEQIRIERRGRPVAMLNPMPQTGRKAVTTPDVAARLSLENAVETRSTRRARR